MIEKLEVEDIGVIIEINGQQVRQYNSLDIKIERLTNKINEIIDRMNYLEEHHPHN